MKYLLLLLLISCASKEVPKVEVPSPVIVEEKKEVSVPPTLNGNIQILVDFVHSDRALASDWVTSTTRKIFDGQVTGYITRGDLCKLVGILSLDSFAMLPITTKYRSAIEYPVGVYYDALVPLTKDNCKTSKYAWIDLANSFDALGLKITLDKSIGKRLETPAITLTAAFEPFAFMQAMNNFVYKDDSYMDNALPVLAMLREHRITPHKTYINLNPSSPEFIKFVKFEKEMNVPESTDKALNKLAQYKPWIYKIDEPSDSSLAKEIPAMKRLRQSVPDVDLLVTTTYKPAYKDLVTLFCPVAEQFNDVKYPYQCIYFSCMANGCGPNRAWENDPKKLPPHVDYHATGSPDYSLDAPPSNLFGVFLVANKVGARMTLYYNLIENFGLMKFGVDPFVDSYNFGANGDGALLYPNKAGKSVFTSVRLKLLREASYMNDAITINKKTKLVSDAVKSPLNWKFSKELRDQAYEK